MDEFSKDMAKEIVSQTAGQAYKDAVQPLAKAVGNVIALPFQAVDAALSPVKLWISGKNMNYDKAKQMLAEKLKEVQPEKIVSPEPYVFVPAIQQLAYSYDSDKLRMLYANLIASAMNMDKKQNVHPAYVNIIAQLSPDEAVLLSELANNVERLFPIVDIILKKEKTSSFQIACSNFTTVACDKLTCKSNIRSYMDNLERLKLIVITDKFRISESKVYDSVYRSEFYRNTVSSIRKFDGYELGTKDKVFYISDFGKAFIECVL